MPKENEKKLNWDILRWDNFHQSTDVVSQRQLDFTLFYPDSAFLPSPQFLLFFPCSFLATEPYRED